MSNRLSNVSRWLNSKRAVIGLTSCGFGLGLVLLGYSAARQCDPRLDSSPKSTPLESSGVKPRWAWNVALGEVVIMVPELGFSVIGLQEASIQEAKIGKRIENQLLGLRQLYRGVSEKNPTLMGSMLLQLAVDPSGNVTHVEELTSRLADNGFKETVLAEISKWHFHELVTDSVKINFPLLFVREGMDMTTLVQWEKGLGRFEERAALVPSEGLPIPTGKPPPIANPTGARVNQQPSSIQRSLQKPAARTAAAVYEIKSPATVHKEPRFASSSLAKVAAGAKVTVVGVHGDWLEIRLKENGPSGFIRREFTTPIDGVRKR